MEHDLIWHGTATESLCRIGSIKTKQKPKENGIDCFVRQRFIREKSRRQSKPRFVRQRFIERSHRQSKPHIFVFL